MSERLIVHIPTPNPGEICGLSLLDFHVFEAYRNEQMQERPDRQFLDKNF